MVKVMAKKPKTKKWVKIVSPKIFNEIELGETLTSQPSKVKGKIIDVSIANLIGDFSKQHFRLRLIIDEVKENVGITKIKSLYVSKPHIIRRIRKGASKIDFSEKVKIKGGTEVIAKVILLTSFKAHQTQVRMLRERLKEHIEKTFANYNIEALVLALCANKIQAEAQTKLKKTYPIKYLEVREVIVV